MTEPLAFIPFPPIERHGVIGDRRTAALVAADGTVDSLCLPDYDGTPIFGALLDAGRGGFWRQGPAESVFGRQRYVDDSAVLVTTWETDGGELELTDALDWPGDERPAGEEKRRVTSGRPGCASPPAARPRPPGAPGRE